jgi:MraZ protein
MTRFLGEYDCKLDPKGRIILPAGLKRQVPAEAEDTFVVNRGFEKCLVLYPKNEWEKISLEINNLNPYKKQNREFIRYFFRGASELTLDTQNRLLLPKRLLEYAGIDKELVLFAHTNKIEIWAKDNYDSLLSDEPEDFSGLAEIVMGNGKKEEND